MSDADNSTNRPQLRRYQFGLRSLLLVMATIALLTQVVIWNPDIVGGVVVFGPLVIGAVVGVLVGNRRLPRMLLYAGVGGGLGGAVGVTVLMACVVIHSAMTNRPLSRWSSFETHLFGVLLAVHILVYAAWGVVGGLALAATTWCGLQIWGKKK